MLHKLLVQKLELYANVRLQLEVAAIGDLQIHTAN